MKIALGLPEYNFIWVTKRTIVKSGIAAKIAAASGESLVFRSGWHVNQTAINKRCVHLLVMNARVLPKQWDGLMASECRFHQKVNLLVCS